MANDNPGECMDFTGWPAWLILAVILLTTFSNPHVLKFFGGILSALGIIQARKNEAELEADRWSRNREDWFRDTMFDLIKAMFADFQKQSESRDKTILETMLVLQKNTEAIGKNADATKLLARKIIDMEEIITEQVVSRLDLLDTQHLGRSPAND